MHQIRQNARPTIREKREKRAQIREREGRSRLAAPTSGAIVALRRRAAWSSIERCDRRARSSDAHRSSIDERCDCPTSALVDQRETSALVDRDRRSRRSSARCDRWTSGAIVDRAAHRRGAIVDRTARRRGAARSGLSLLSLSLSLFPEVIWSENEGRKWFPGQRWKYWSTGSHFLWQPNTSVLWKMISGNSFHPIQTHPKSKQTWGKM